MTKTNIAPEDRVPTFAEFEAFDPGRVWDRLTPGLQREIGILAVRLGTIGECGGYFHETIEQVRHGFDTAHWPAEVQETCVLPADQVELIEARAFDVMPEFSAHMLTLWPLLFGWTGEVAS